MNFRDRVDVRVQTFGVADVLQDPGSEIGQACVLGQHQAWPWVTLRHVEGRDSHGTTHLTHINDKNYEKTMQRLKTATWEINSALKKLSTFSLYAH